MRRLIVITTMALVLAAAPAAVFAQDPPAQPAQPEAKPLGVPLTTPAGLLLVPIKPSETAAFEEMAARILASIEKTEDATLRQQGQGIKIYKASELMGGNVLYVIMVDPAVPNADYEPFAMIVKGMTEQEQRDAAESKLWDRFRNAFAAPMNRISLTPVGK